MNWASKCNHFEEVESLMVGITTGGRRLSFPSVGESLFVLLMRMSFSFSLTHRGVMVNWAGECGRDNMLRLSWISLFPNISRGRSHTKWRQRHSALVNPASQSGHASRTYGGRRARFCSSSLRTAGSLYRQPDARHKSICMHWLYAFA